MSGKNLLKKSLLTLATLASLSRCGIYDSTSAKNNNANIESVISKIDISKIHTDNIIQDSSKRYVPSTNSAHPSNMLYDSFNPLKISIVNNDTLIDLSDIALIKPLSKNKGPRFNGQVWDTIFQKTIDYVVDTMSLNSEVVNDDVIRACIYSESRYYPWAVPADKDSTGKKILLSSAKGLMQPLKGTWKSYSDKSFNKYGFDPIENITVGTEYLLYIEEYIAERYKNYRRLPLLEQQKLVIAAYHGGHGKLKRKSWNINKMDPATREYVDIVTSRMTYIQDTRRKEWLARTVSKHNDGVLEFQKYYN